MAGRISHRRCPIAHKRKGVGGRGFLMAQSIVLPLLLLLLRPCKSQGMTSGSSQTSYTYSPSPLGRTEGCFNAFPALLSITFGGDDNEEELSNAACQALCAKHAFSVSATSARACKCGNVLPPIVHRVEDTHCDDACSSDDAGFCAPHSCCGSLDGAYYTVAFAGESDMRKSLLRTLMADYRNKAKTYQSYISSLMAEATMLQVLPSTSMAAAAAAAGSSGGTAYSSLLASSSETNSGVSDVSGTSGGDINTAAPLGYVGLGGGCPQSWETVGDSCFRRLVVGSSQNHNQGQSACKVEGGTLAIPTDPHQQDAITALVASDSAAGSEEGSVWIGLSAKDSLLGPYWGWDDYSNWSGDQPDTSSGGDRGPAYGPAKGAVFDEFSPDIISISKIIITYTALGSIVSLKTSYRMRDGSISESQERGGGSSRTSLLGRSTDTITLAVGEWITAAFGFTTSSGLASLTLITTDMTGQWTQHGPYGRSLTGGTPFTFTATADVKALYGRTDGSVITQLGFYQYRGKGCTQINELGQFETIFCDHSFQQPFYLCERPHTTSMVQCPSGWKDAGRTCMRSFRADGPMTWLAGKAACAVEQGHLAHLDSQSKASMGWALMQQASGFIGLRDYSLSSLYSVYGWDRYDNYAKGQPRILVDNSTKTRLPTCIMMAAAAAGSGKWSTVGCSEKVDKVGIVCESEAMAEDCSCASGWDAFMCRCYQAVSTVRSSSWLEADAYCKSLSPSGRLARIPNQETNDKVKSLAPAMASGVFLGLADMLGNGVISERTHVAWGGGQQPAAEAGNCAVMRTNGQWYSVPCVSGVPASLCSMSKAPTTAYLGQQGGQAFQLVEVPGQDLLYGEPFQVQIVDNSTGNYLAVAPDGSVYSTDLQQGASTRPSSTTFTINFLKTGGSSATGGPNSINPAFTIMNHELKRYLVFDTDTKQLVTAENANPQLDPVGNGFATAFMAAQVVPALALRRLQVSIASQGTRNSTAAQYCTAYVYDYSPNTDSYTCYDVQGGTGSNLPMVEVEMVGWATQDKASVLFPRAPIEDARVECHNEDASQPSVCQLTYDGAQIYTASFSIQHGYSMQKQFIIKTDPSSAALVAPRSFLDTFGNTYTDTTEVSYLATDTRTVMAPVPPLITTVIQFWQATVQTSYTWQAVFLAEGSFHMSTMGVTLGDMRSLSTLSSPQDLHLYLWGRRSYPSLSQVVATVGLDEYTTYPFDKPPNSGSIPT